MNRITKYLATAPATLLVTAISLLAFATPGMSSAMEFHAHRVADGQWWRVLTCHVTHYSVGHLGWDLAVFLVLGLLCERRNCGGTWGVLILCALTIPPQFGMAARLGDVPRAFGFGHRAVRLPRDGLDARQVA